MTIRSLGALCGLALVCAGSAAAEPAVAPAEPAVLPEPGDHWVWVTDRLWQHSLLFDGDSGRALGTIDGAIGAVTPKLPLHSRRRGEIYSVDIAYSRGKRGDRIDFVTIYDSRTLAVTGEVVLPGRTADANTSLGYTALLDGDRFLATFNQLPIASVTIVDLDARRAVGDVAIAGCAGIFPIGERRFATLCDDGTIAVAELDDRGRQRAISHSERFFDPVADPVTMAGVRVGSRWVFVSFEGRAHAIDFATTPPRAAPPWSLFDEADRRAGWRVGGLQHLALHAGSRRLYSIVHVGGPGSHKAAGPEIWVYDVEQERRVDRFAVPNLTAAFFGAQLGVEAGGALDWGLRYVVPSEGAHSIAVTQDAAPLLFVRNAELGVVAVLDARTGSHLRNVDEAGIAGATMGVH